MNGVVLYGAGGHCKVVIDILQSIYIPVAYLVDDSPALEDFMGYRVRKDTGLYENAIITIGSCAARRTIANRILVKRYITAIHPSAIVSSSVRVGCGTVVMPGSILQTCACVGNHCVINTGALVEHDVVIHDFVHIAPNVTVCGGTSIGTGTWVGAGTTLIQRIHVGENCVIGAGSVVVSDIPDGVVAYGNPCKIIKQNNL